MLLVLGAVSHAAAQQPLTIADARARALAVNHDIRVERDAVAVSEARQLTARGAYDPTLQLDFGVRHRKNPVTTLFSGAPEGEVAATSNGFVSSAAVTQLFKTGAIATASASLGRDSTNNVFTLLSPAYTTSLGVELRQPLLRSRAIDPARAALRLTALDRDRSSAALDRRAMETVASVETAYWTLVAARREREVRRLSVTLAENQRADTAVRVQAQTVPASDLAQPTAEVGRRTGDLHRADENVARAERALKVLILDDPADPLWTAEIEPASAPAPELPAMDVQSAIRSASENRQEFAELRAAISGRQIEADLARDGLKPRVDLVASYFARGLAGSRNPHVSEDGPFPAIIPDPLNGGLGGSFVTLGEGRFPDASIGVSVEVPIGRKAARGELAAVQASQRQLNTRLAQTANQIATEVRNAVTAVETAARRITSARAELSAAQVQLKAEQDRYSVGATTNFFVLERQTNLADAQLAEIAAETDYRNALVELGRATGTLRP
jgi:HAE1 family hydrophobic/amphiphilic exporter-1